MNRTHTRTLATLALLCAMEIILARFCVIWITNSIKITFEAIPILMAGILFGPAAGAVVGAVSDILGAYFPAWAGSPCSPSPPPCWVCWPDCCAPSYGKISPCPDFFSSLSPVLCWAVCSGLPGGSVLSTAPRCLPCWPFVFRCTVSSLCWIRSCSFSSAAAASSAAWDCGQSKPKKEGMLS